MRKIYLASDSKARRRLLKVFGLKFKVIPANIAEKTQAKGASYAKVAINNALAKAKYVAARVRGGVIIGADTIVVQSGKLYGKPKDLKDARVMLKRLSSRPHTLYTGLAVIDKDRNRRVLACEKTKIFMDRLTDEAIDRYFSATSPLDKAGGFDIQGKGALFIRRIEGCFYNVVGLPLRTLYRIFKELNLL